jgi:hypothetical protein
VGIPLLEEEGRERFLDQAELARLMPVLMEAEGHLVVPARIVRFLLATGLRISECFHCRWEHIDIERKQMSIPASHAKSKRLDSIPLNAAAIQVLKECDRGGPHAFSNPSTGNSFVTIKKSFATLMDRAGLEGVTAHVMRHTAASLMINGGQSLYSVQRILRHSSSKVTEKYAHLSTRTLQDASDTISEQLLRAASGDNWWQIGKDAALGLIASRGGVTLRYFFLITTDATDELAKLDGFHEPIGVGSSWAASVRRFRRFSRESFPRADQGGDSGRSGACP